MPYGQGDPQLEDGYAAIANEILDALAQTDLTGAESRCIFFLWRKTYGWKDKSGQAKKEDKIGYSQWSAGTGIDRRNVIRTLDSLVKRKIMLKHVIPIPGKNSLTIWSFQKKYHDWNGFHEAEPVSFQTLLPIQAVAPMTLDSAQPVSETTLPSFKPVSPLPKPVSPVTLEVVSSAPPTISNISNTISNTTTKGSDLEENLLGLLATLSSWNLHHDEDLDWIKEFIQEFPTFDAGKVKHCRDWHSGKKKHSKALWKTRLRNWMKNEEKKSVQGGKSTWKNKKTPTTDQLGISWEGVGSSPSEISPEAPAGSPET